MTNTTPIPPVTTGYRAWEFFLCSPAGWVKPCTIPMNYKLQCMSDRVAGYAHQRWPACTIQAGSALLCFDITPDELAMIQQYTGAYTVELSDKDIRLIERYGTVPGTE